jgi:formaldehyde-activating enzyme involved in methanogenesis
LKNNQNEGLEIIIELNILEMEGSPDIVIKKATMIKKNTHDINQVYSFEKGVKRAQFYV